MKGMMKMSLRDHEKVLRIKHSLEKRVVTLPDGTFLPSIGQGTWYMGENPQSKKRNQSFATWNRTRHEANRYG